MPPIKISHKHSMDHAHACETVRQIASQLASRYGISHQWHDDKLTFNRPGLDGCIEVHEDHVDVLASLGLMLSPLKGRLTQEVEQMLDKHFGTPD